MSATLWLRVECWSHCSPLPHAAPLVSALLPAAVKICKDVCSKQLNSTVRQRPRDHSEWSRGENQSCHQVTDNSFRPKLPMSPCQSMQHGTGITKRPHTYKMQARSCRGSPLSILPGIIVTQMENPKKEQCGLVMAVNYRSLPWRDMRTEQCGIVLWATHCHSPCDRPRNFVQR